jgi:hypothetical protein
MLRLRVDVLGGGSRLLDARMARLSWMREVTGGMLCLLIVLKNSLYTYCYVIF